MLGCIEWSLYTGACDRRWMVIEEHTAQATDMDQFHAELERDEMDGLWRVQAQRAAARPRSQPHVWRWERIYRHLLRAGELLTLDRGAERRVIVLANPGLPA